MILEIILLGVILVITYFWFLKPLVCYAKAVKAFGFNEVILIYHPFHTNITYNEYLNKVDQDSMLEIKKKIHSKPNAKIIIYGYLFYTLQNIIDPDYIKYILSNELMSSIQKMKFIFSDTQYHSNMVFADKQKWKNSRRIISNVFHFQYQKTQQSFIQNIVEEQISNLQGKQVNLFQLGCSITGRVVTRTMLGKQFEKIHFGKLNCFQQARRLDQELVYISMAPLNMIRTILTNLLTPPKFLMSQKQKQFLIDNINFKSKGKQYLTQLFKRYQNGQVIEAKFIQVYFEEPNPKQYFDQILQHFMLFLAAGQETTSSLIESSLYVLAQHPEYQQIILKQFDQKRDKSIHSLEFLNNFINQTNRLYGPARNTLIRKVVKPFKIGKYQFVKDSYLAAGTGFVMYNPKYFDDPLQFVPQRWNNIENMSNFFPFSTGPRNCIGQHLTKIQVRIALICILKKYKLKRTNVSLSILSSGNLSYYSVNHNLVEFHPK